MQGMGDRKRRHGLVQVFFSWLQVESRGKAAVIESIASSESLESLIGEGWTVL